MEDLIAALTILSKYTESSYPTWCEHDVLHVAIDPRLISDEDTKELRTQGFIVSVKNDDIYSFRYGSC